MKWALSALFLAATFLAVPSDAHALLFENGIAGEDELIYHFPYPTTYTYVDQRYAFDDDPLNAFVHEPFFMPVVVKRTSVRRGMVMPRMSFVQEMYKSTDVL